MFLVMSLVVQAAVFGGSSLCLKYLNIEKWILQKVFKVSADMVADKCGQFYSVTESTQRLYL